ncbi:hypothetical protein OF83DRAFT_439726 [Amylostereum chailletii]|nr:hypothetical protein OF83DRAFT_439726 [Amylostereum chailletii]
MTDSHIVHLLFFKGNERCLADPTLFTALRDMAKESAGEGLTGQYWGQAVEKPHRFYWYLLWGSQSAHDAFQSSPQRTALHSQLLALAEETPDERVMAYSLSPLGAFQAPITDTTAFNIVEGITREEAVTRMTPVIQHVGRILPTFLWAFAKDVEGKGLRGVHFAGWDSIESHMNVGEGPGEEDLREVTEEVMPMFTNITIAHMHLQSHQ